VEGSTLKETSLSKLWVKQQIKKKKSSVSLWTALVYLSGRGMLKIQMTGTANSFINTFTAGYLNAHQCKNAGHLKGPQPLLSRFQ